MFSAGGNWFSHADKSIWAESLYKKTFLLDGQTWHIIFNPEFVGNNGLITLLCHFVQSHWITAALLYDIKLNAVNLPSACFRNTVFTWRFNKGRLQCNNCWVALMKLLCSSCKLILIYLVRVVLRVIWNCYFHAVWLGLRNTYHGLNQSRTNPVLTCLPLYIICSKNIWSGRLMFPWCNCYFGWE